MDKLKALYRWLNDEDVFFNLFGLICIVILISAMRNCYLQENQMRIEHINKINKCKFECLPNHYKIIDGNCYCDSSLEILK